MGRGWGSDRRSGWERCGFGGGAGGAEEGENAVEAFAGENNSGAGLDELEVAEDTAARLLGEAGIGLGGEELGARADGGFGVAEVEGGFNLVGESEGARRGCGAAGGACGWRRGSGEEAVGGFTNSRPLDAEGAKLGEAEEVGTSELSGRASVAELLSLRDGDGEGGCFGVGPVVDGTMDDLDGTECLGVGGVRGEREEGVGYSRRTLR